MKAEDFLNCIYTAAGDSSGIEVEEFLLNLKCDTGRIREDLVGDFIVIL